MLGIGGRDMGDERYPDEIRKEQKELGATEGVQVVEVTEGGSADGFLQKNDVILKLNDKTVKTMADLQGTLAKYRPGDKVKITVLRDKKEKTFTITLKNSQGTTKVVKQADMELLGAAFRAVPNELKKQLNLGYGVEVTGIDNGRMKDSGIRKGFIILKANGKQLRTVQDLENVMKAEEQLQGSGLILFKDRLPETPSIADWLGSILKPGEKVGIDGWVNSTSEALQLQKALEKYHLELVNVEDPFHLLWRDRPSLPLNPPFILPLEYSGEACNQKISRIQAILKENQVNGILISALDEIAWTLNLRGTDVHCNPVFVSYLFITSTSSTLYIQPDKLTDEVRRYLETNHVSIKDYTQIAQELEEHKEGCLQLPSSTNYTLYQAASKSSQVKLLESPVLYLKSIKNATEIAGFKQAMTRDGVAMVRFLYWLENAVKSGTETELSIDQKLYEFRSAQENFQGISFDTIAGYQEHGAIVHYEATEETAATLKPEGFLLLDSGGQYLDGTTDITRTIALGHVTEEQKKDYTLILKGFIQLSMAHFPYGTCGTQLDVLARQFIWKEGMNYGHGTGHGGGHCPSLC